MENAKKGAIALAVTISVITAGGIVVKNAQASTTGNRSSAIQAIVDKFHLNQSDVDKTLQEFRVQRQQTRLQEISNSLDKAVKDGVITSAQKKLILQKHEQKIQERMKDIGQMRQNRGKHGAEMQEWMAKNNIDHEKLSQYLKPSFAGQHKGYGKGYRNSAR